MRITLLKHVHFEDSTWIREWCILHKYALEVVHMWENVGLDELEIPDLLILLGGPMSVHDTKDHPWLLWEKAFIRNCIDSSIPILGICLGAQLLAQQLGAEIIAQEAMELGWLPVKRSESVTKRVVWEDLKLPDTLTTFHWHGESFSLPRGAQLLYSSEYCTNQAFLHGTRHIGLQFHPEMSLNDIQSILENGKEDLAKDSFSPQSADNILVQWNDYAAINRHFIENVLSYLAIKAKRKNAYIPIDCHYYDFIEETILSRNVTRITYLSDTGNEVITHKRITDTYTLNKEEFLILDNLEHIRMDRLIAINDHQVP